MRFKKPSTNFTMQAVELGYGTCWIGAFDEESVKVLLHIPMSKKVVVCMAFGNPKGRQIPKSRKAIDEFVYLNRFGKR